MEWLEYLATRLEGEHAELLAMSRYDKGKDEIRKEIKATAEMIRDIAGKEIAKYGKMRMRAYEILNEHKLFTKPKN